MCSGEVCLAVVCMEAGFSQIRSHILHTINVRHCVSIYKLVDKQAGLSIGYRIWQTYEGETFMIFTIFLKSFPTNYDLNKHRRPWNSSNN